jgi:hypothetical protein
LPTRNTLLIKSLHPAIELLPATMLLLPIFLAAKALAANTYTVTVLNEEPDARTLSIPATTAAGDVLTYLTLFPDGVDQDGQTKFVDRTDVAAGETVTGFLDIPTSTAPTTTPAGTLTQGLPWHNGHHIEVLTVTEANGSVHEVTRIDQQSTHVTVHPETKSNGDVVLVSSYPTSTYPTSTITPTPYHTQERLMQHVRALPFCNNDIVTWSSIEEGCWPVYDMMVPTPARINLAKEGECTGNHHRTIPFTVATIPMKGSTPTDATSSRKIKEGRVKEPRDTVEGSLGRSDKCEVVQDFVDFGTCGGVHVVAMTGRETLRGNTSRKAWILRFWWVPAIILLGLLLLCLPCLLCLRRHRRRNTQKPVKQEAVTVVEQPVAVVAANGGAAGGAAGSAAGGTAGGAAGSGGAGGAGGGGSTVTQTAAPVATTAPAKAAPATTTATAAPTEVVTTTTETDKNHAGTMRRAAEEGRAGPRVRFDGQPAENNPAAAHQVDGTAEMRTGSEVFDVGSMRGRKRNRGDEPL